jgi:hypothetical protein
MAFDAGYEAAADHATCGELLAEAQALQRRSTTWTARQGGRSAGTTASAPRRLYPAVWVRPRSCNAE